MIPTVGQLRKRIEDLTPPPRPAGLTAQEMTDDELASAILGRPSRAEDISNEELAEIIQKGQQANNVDAAGSL